MAQFDANINLVAQVDKALRGVRRVERAIDKIRSTSLELDVKTAAIKQVENSANNLTKSFLVANKAAKALSVVLKGFASSFINGPAEELARALTAANAQTELLLDNTSGYVNILKAAAKEQRYVVELARRNAVAQAASKTTISQLNAKISRVSRAQDRLVVGSRAQENVAKTLNKLEEQRNEVYKRRETQLRRIRQEQERIAETVKKNIRASARARQVSGFGDFSRLTPAGIAQARAQERRRRRRARLPRTEIESRPLALPSTELLKATARGIQRIETAEERLLRTQKEAIRSQERRNRVERTLAETREKVLRGTTAGVGDAGLGLFGPGTPAGERAFRDTRARAKAVRNSWVTALRDIDKTSEQINRNRLERVKEFDRAQDASIRRTRRGFENLRRSVSNRVGGAFGGGLIGAGFPALFGAGRGEIAGGGIGGVLGGLLLGGQGGFTGSIVGSAIGRLVETEAKIKSIGKELGFSAKQAEILGQAYEQAGFKGAEAFEGALVQVQGLGISLEEQVSLVQSASRLVTAYGGALDKVINAVSQTILKGKVGIADLNKLQSQGIPIQEELADALGVTRSKLLELTKDGKVSVQELIDEFIDLAIKAEDAPKRAESEFQKLEEAILDVATAVGTLATELLRVLNPALETIVSTATRAVNTIRDLIAVGSVGDLQRTLTIGAIGDKLTFGATQQTITDIALALKEVSAEGLKTAEGIDAVELAVARAAARAQQFKGAAGELSLSIVQPEITRLQNEIAAARDALNIEQAPKPIPIEAPGQLEPPPGRSAKPPRDEAAELLARQLKAGEDLSREFARQNELLQIRNRFDRQLIENANDYDDAVRRINETAAPLQREGLISQAAVRLDLENLRTLEDAAKAFGQSVGEEFAEKIPEAVEELKVVEGLVNGIGREFTGLFETLITGTEDWNKVIQDTLFSFSRLLLQAGLTLLGGNDQQGVFSILSGNFGGARANGGPVSSGTPYLVGERGPELFVPGRSGAVVPNDAMGGSTVVNITVNTDGGGSSSASGDRAEEARRLGKMVEAATLAVIQRERRPGGSLR